VLHNNERTIENYETKYQEEYLDLKGDKNQRIMQTKKLLVYCLPSFMIMLNEEGLFLHVKSQSMLVICIGKINISLILSIQKKVELARRYSTDAET